MVKEKRHEEYAYVLDFMPKARSKIWKNREGPIVQVVGEVRYTLLELLAFDDASFNVGERIYVGKEKRDKISAVLGKLSAYDLTERAKESLRNKNISAQIINERKEHFQNLIKEELFPW
jgi:putative nucleotide binding protein